MKSALALAALAGTTAGLTNQAHAAQYDWNSNTAANSSWTGTVITDGWNVNPASSVTTTLVFSDNSASSFTTSNTAAFTFNTMQLNGGSGGTITIASSSALVASGATPAGIVMNATGTGIYNVTAPFSVSSGETLQFSGAGNDTFNFSGIISGSGALSFTNSNTVNLSGVNTYTGGMTITGGGTINVYNSQVAATGPIVIGSSGTSTGGILNVESGATVSASSITLGNSGSTNPLGETINSAGTVTDSGALSLVRGGFVNMTAGTWTQTGALTVNGNGGFGSTLTVSGGSTFTYNSGTAISVISTASNSAGGATVAIDGTNSTFVTGTNFAGSGSSSSATSIFMIAGGTLKLSGNVASDLFSGIGTVSLQSGTETFNVATFTANTSNVISGNGSLAVTGTTGNLSLSGANTYSGKTYAAGGTLEFGQAAALYGGTPANWTPTNITVSSGATLALATGTGGFTEGNIATLLSQLDVNASGGFQSGAAIGIDTSGGNLTYTSVITNPNSGSLGVAVLGANTLFLVNNETYTGTTTIAAGSHLQIGGGSYTAASISSSGSIVDNGALNFYNGGAAEISNYTYSHVISGAGSLTLNGASSNIITLAANNTYTGTTTIVNSTLQLGNGTLSTGSITGSGSIVDSGALVFDTPAGGFTYNHAISGSGTLTLEANGEMTLFVADSYTGATTISAGRVDVANNASFGGSVVTISGSSTTTSGTGGEALLPTANVTLANNFSISGFGGYEGDSVNYGAIRLGAAAEAITGTVTLTGNSGIAVQTADTGTIFGNISALANTDNLTINNGTQTGTLILTANNTLNSGLTIVQGTLQLGNGSLTTGSISSASSIVDNGTLVFDTATNGFTYSQAISGSGALTQSGADTITITAADTYTGTTTIAAGSHLQIGGGSYTAASISSSGSIVDNGALNFYNGGAAEISNYTYSHVISGAGSLTLNGASSNIITLAANNTYTGTTTIIGSTLQVGNGGTAGSITASGSIVDSGTLVFNNNQVYGFSGYSVYTNPISGSGSITVAGGSIALVGTNSYTGTTTVAAGVLEFGGDNSLYNDTTASWTAGNIIVSSGAALMLEPGNFTAAELNTFLTSAGGPIVGATGTTGLESGSTLAFNATGAGTTLSTTITNAGSAGANTLNVKLFTGSMTLTADNTYTGSTTIGGNGAAAATLYLGNGGTTGSITNTSSIIDSGTLVFDTNTTNYNYSQVISGSGAVTQSGTGVITLNNDETYTGATTIASTRTLQIGDGNLTVGSISKSGSIVDSGLLIFDNTSAAASQTYSSVISGSGSMTILAGTVQLGNGNVLAETLTGAVTVSSGAMLVLDDTGSTNIGFYKASSVTIDGTVVTDLDNALFGSGSNVVPLTINAGGILTSLASADGGGGTSSNIRGLLTLNGGTLASAGTGRTDFGSWDLEGGVLVTANSTISATDVSPDQSGGTNININAGDTLNVTGTFIDPTSAADTGINLNPTSPNTGTLILANNNTYAGATTIYAGILQVGNGGTTGSISASGSIADSGALVFDTATNGFTYSNVISGSGAVTQSGSDTITLAANETYTGATTVGSGATLQISNGSAAGNITASSSITANGTLFFDSSTFFTYSNPMSGSGTITFGGTDPLILHDKLFTGTINITSTDTLQLGNGTISGSFTNAGIINDGGALVFDSNSGTENYNYSMSITGGGSVTQSGSDTITLSGSNTVSGQTNANAGTLDLANTNALQNSILNMNGGAVTFDASVVANAFNIAGLTGSTNLSLLNTTGNAINLTLTNASTTYAGVLSDGGLGSSLTIAAGTQTLTANNSYTGATTLGAGAMLMLGSGGASGSISNSSSIVDNGTLVFNSTTAGLVYSNPISGSGGITQYGSGYTILQADNSFTGVTTIGGAALQIGSGTAGGITGSSSIVDNNALNFQTTDTGANATYSSAISGYGSVSLTSSTITLAGNNSYTGATTIDGASTLQVGNGAASGNITNSSGITDNGALIFDNTSATGQTYNNPISGSGSLAVNAGTVTLAYQAETLTGAVTVASGATLALANTNNGSPSGLYEVSSLTLGGTVVTDSDNALFGYNDPHTPALTINSGGVLTNLASADGGTGTSVQILSLITMNGGTLATNGSLTATNTAVTGLGQSEYGSWELYGGINVTANSTISAQQVVAVQSGGLQINIATGDTLNVSGSFITPLGLSDTGIILNPTAGKAGTLLFTGASTYTAATTIDAGTVQIGNGGSTGSITSTSNITNNGALVFNTSASSTYGMVISGSGSVTQSGTGTITLSNTETYTGTTTISSGTINLTGKLGDTAVTVNNGGTLAAAATTSLGATSGTSLTLLSGSTLNLADGTVGNFTINNSAGSYSGTALSLQGATIDMDLGNSSVDQLVVANGNAVISGTNTINFSTTGDTSLTDGTYTILNVENGTKSASPVFEFANHSTKEAINVGGTYYTLSLVDPSGSEMLDIGSASQSIITLSAAGAGTPTGFTSGQQILNHGTPTTAYQGVFSTGTSALTVTGSNGNYAFKTATHINSQGTGNTNSNQGNTTAYIEINGFNPANDEEIAALGIDDNGSLLTATPDGASISTTSIASDINTYWDASGQSGTIAYVLAGSQYAGVFGTTQYNVYLDFTAGQLANLGLSSSGDNYLAFDFTADPIFNGTSADLTVTAVAVVPEPSSLGLMGLGVMGLAAGRRRRRKNRKA